MRRILFQETDFESLPNPPAGFKYIGFDGPNFTEKDDTGVSSPAGGSGGLTEITHSQIIDKILNSDLTTGLFYKITDFKTCYDQPDFNIYGSAITTGNYKVGNTHSIVVLAISATALSIDAWQPDFPKDKIRYDVSWTQSEHTGGTAYGRITERIDEWNNRTDYDHREVLFKRYNTFVYNPNQPQAGTISIVSGVVSGIDTLFTNFSVGQIIAIPHFSEMFFKINTIESNFTMSLTGSYWDVSANDIKYYQTIDSIYSYQRNNVDDYSEGSPYIYEFTTFGDAIDNFGAFNNYIGDQAISYIESGDGDFILSNNVFFSGVYFNNTFGNNCYNNTFDDDCTNNTIGHYFRNNTTDDDFDQNKISNYFQNNLITANFQRNVVGENFNNNSIVNSDFYRNKIGEQFQNNKVSGSDFQNNVIGNAFNDNIVRIAGVGFLKNVIGVGFNGNDIWGGEFNSNKIGNGMNNNTLYCDFYENKIGDYFETNTIGSESSFAYFYQNNIDNDFDTNQIYANFYDNNVGINAYNNNFYNFTFGNDIGINFENNTIGTINNVGGFDFEKNKIGVWCKGNYFIGSIDSNEFGNYFWTNEILDSSYANKIGSDFQNNDVHTGFEFNTIANSCQNNIFGTDSRYNILGGDFQENVIGTEFEYNNIGSEFNQNTIGNFFKHNNISNFFELNIISYDFKQNNIGNFFGDNSISFNFACNVIGDSFFGNTIENDFGFGGGQSRGNKIGNYFYNNSIGEYFYDNIIADLFNNNTIGDYFMLNHVKANNIYNIDFTLNYGNILSFTDNTGASPSIPGTDNIYIGLTCSDGQGVEATFDVTVSGSVVANVAIANSGRLYLSGDSLTIIGSKFGGTDGQDIIMTVTTVSATPSVYGSYNSNIFRNSNGNNRLSYYDGDDVLTITNIDE